MNNKELAKILDTAFLNAKAVEQLSKKQSISEADAYVIQKELLQLRYDRGEKFIGVKLGFTSQAKMDQMGVKDMIFGQLTDRMLIEDKGSLNFSGFIHPRAEPEICFITKKEINSMIKYEELKDYIGFVAAAIEIIDSRYEDFEFELADVIADNCSSAAFVVGEKKAVDIPISDLQMDLKIEYQTKERGSSKAILGDPWLSVIAAARLAAENNLVIPAHSYIMAGAATSAIYLREDENVQVEVESLGSVSFNVI